MNCTKCNAPIPEGSNFCTKCGQKVEIPTAPAAPVAKFCANCGKQIPDGARFCAACGTPMDAPAAPVAAPAPVVEPVAAPAPAPVVEPVAAPTPQPAPQPAPQPVYQPVYQTPVYQAPVATAPAAPKKKSKVGLIIAIVVIALALVGGVIAGFATDWFGLAASSYVDEDDDKDGGKKDLSQEDDKTGEDDDQPGGTAISGSSAFAHVGEALAETVEDTNFTMYLTLGDGYDTYYIDLWMDSDIRSEELLFKAKVYSNDMEMDIAYYNDYLILGMDGEYHAVQITAEQLEKYVQDNLSATGMDIDAAATINSMEDILDLLRENMDEETLSQIEAAIDFDKLESCLEDLAENLNQNDWLADNLGMYSTGEGDNMTYVFDHPDLYDLAGALVDQFTPALKDATIADSLTEALDSIKADLRGIDVYLSFSIVDGMLSDGNFSIEMDGEELSANISFVDVGTTSVDEDELQDLLDLSEIHSFDELFQGYSYDDVEMENAVEAA